MVIFGHKLSRPALFLLLACLLSSCDLLPQHLQQKAEWPLLLESEPRGKINHAKLAGACPDFTGVYYSGADDTELTYITQNACEMISIIRQTPFVIERNSYVLDGETVTLRKGVMQTVPVVARMSDNRLLLEIRLNNFIKTEEWVLQQDERGEKSRLLARYHTIRM